MYQLALLYVACILAGFALTNVPVSAVITPAIANFLGIVGGIVIVVFAVAVIYLGVKTLLNK